MEKPGAPFWSMSQGTSLKRSVVEDPQISLPVVRAEEQPGSDIRSGRKHFFLLGQPERFFVPDLPEALLEELLSFLRVGPGSILLVPCAGR